MHAIYPPNVSYIMDSRRTAATDNRGHTLTVTPVAINLYPLRSVVFQQLRQLGLRTNYLFNHVNMFIPEGSYKYHVSKGYLRQLNNWMRENDTNNTYSSLEVDNSSLFRGEYAWTNDYIVVSDAVWQFLMTSFGGGPRIRYRNFGKPIIFKLLCDSCPYEVRHFIFNSDQTIIDVKREIAQIMELDIASFQIHELSGGKPYRQLDIPDYITMKLDRFYIPYNGYLFAKVVDEQPGFFIDYCRLPSNITVKMTKDFASFAVATQNRALLKNIMFGNKNSCYISYGTTSRYLTARLLEINRKKELFEYLSQIEGIADTFNVFGHIDASILKTQQYDCRKLILEGTPLKKSTLVALGRYEKLTRVIVDNDMINETMLFKGLQSCNTLLSFRSTSFLGNKPNNEVKDGKLSFFLRKRTIERVKIPINLASFVGLQMDITSTLLLNPQEPVTRMLFSALFCENGCDVEFSSHFGYFHHFSWIYAHINRVTPVFYI